MEEYPDTNAVLVRRHGVYVWGGKSEIELMISPVLMHDVENWEKAKIMSECYDYLFEIAVKMKSIGIDPAMKPPNEPDYQ